MSRVSRSPLSISFWSRLHEPHRLTALEPSNVLGLVDRGALRTALSHFEIGACGVCDLEMLARPLKYMLPLGTGGKVVGRGLTFKVNIYALQLEFPVVPPRMVTLGICGEFLDEFFCPESEHRSQFLSQMPVVGFPVALDLYAFHRFAVTMDFNRHDHRFPGGTTIAKLLVFHRLQFVLSVSALDGATG